MKDKILPILTLLAGIALSGVAAFYSIIGLTTIFAGAFWSIVIMGSTLEVAKLVAVSWLYHNWKITPTIVKWYLSSAIAILMFITSMGIYGFLSKAHIEQQLKIDTGIVTELPLLNNTIDNHQDAIKDLDKQIKLIDDSLVKMLESNKAEGALKTSDQQQRKRDELTRKRKEETEKLSAVKAKKISIQSEVKKMEAEVGPIKYIAEALYEKTDEQLLDKAVRFVIMIIIVVFDPLAIFLLIAFNISMRKPSEYEMEFLAMPPRRKPGRPRKNTVPQGLPLG